MFVIEILSATARFGAGRNQTRPRVGGRGVGGRTCVRALVMLALTASLGACALFRADPDEAPFEAPSPGPLAAAGVLQRTGQPGAAQPRAGDTATNPAAQQAPGEVLEDIADLQAELARIRPGVDRLLAIESDIRILLDQLAAITELDTSDFAGSPAANSPLQPLTPNLPTPQAPTAAASPSPLSSQTPSAIDAPSLPQLGAPPQPADSPPPVMAQSLAPLSPNAPVITASSAAPRDPPISTPIATSTGPPTPQATAPTVAPGPTPAPAPTPGPTPPNAAPAPAPAQPALAPGFYAHLASYRSDVAAREGWAQLRARHNDVLQFYQPVMRVTDLGERGVYHRLMVGPIGDREAANFLCERLKASDAYCSVLGG